MRLEYRWTGVSDRGDGEPDMEIESPQCPDLRQGISSCGGDSFLDTPAGDDPEREIWKCSDCDGIWNGYGEDISE